MAATRKSLILESGVWTNLYQATGITPGTKIAVQNIGFADVYLSASLSQPANDSDSYQVIQANDFPMANDLNDPGAWAFSPNTKSKINVWEIL